MHCAPGDGQHRRQTAEYPLAKISNRHRVPGAGAVRLHAGGKHRLRRQQPQCHHGGDRGGGQSCQHPYLHK